MHSFASSLSFLLTFASLLAFTGLPFGSAAELSVNSTTFSRDLGVVSGHNVDHRRRHADLNAARVAQARSTDLTLYPGRRASGAEFTYFKTGLGACGNTNIPSDFIVALNKEQFDAADHCGAVITITANGKTARATIQDRCVGCGYNNLDFTTGLYQFFDPTMNGVVQGSWEYGAGATSSSKKTEPTSSKVQPSSTKVHSTTTTKATPSSSSVASSTQKQASASITASSSATPTASSLPNQTEAGNLANLLAALVNVGGLVMNTVPASA